MNENKTFQIFEDYTNSVCRKIMSSKKKNEVRDELYSHLLEDYERNSALGLKDEEAQNKAIEKMGDKEELAEKFGKLYSVSPPEYMNSSLNVFIWGLIFNYLNFEYVSGFEKLCVFIGELLILFSLFKLRKINKQINKALIIFPGLLLFQSIRLFTETYFNIDETIKAILILTTGLLNTVFYWFVFNGLDRACTKVMHKNDKTPHLQLGYIAILIYIANFSFLEWSNYESKFVFVYIPFFIALISIYNSKRILSHKEPEIELNHTLNKKEKFLYAVIVIIATALPLTVMYLSATREPRYEIYNSNDTTIAEKETLFAREHMLDLGFPKEYLDDLPDSEVLKYTTAVYMQLAQEYNYESTPETVKTYYFYFENGGIRALSRIILPDDATAYRNGFYMNFNRGDFTYSNINDVWSEEDYTNYNGQFFLSLSEKDGETVSSEYFNKTELFDTYFNFYSVFTGYEYSFPHNSTQRRAYVAQTAIIQSYGQSHLVSIDKMYYRKHLPIYLTYNHFNEIAYEYFCESREWAVDDFTVEDVNYSDTIDYEGKTLSEYE